MLEAIKVLDLSRVLPGHYASLILGDMGAQIIKIEDTQKVDYLQGT
ncbi:MAG: CoA transferase [Clostridia bacterium]|nr:CoA transferase [Clostridia bacterium]